MTRESKLYPAAIQAQCQSAIAILQADNEKLLATSASVSALSQSFHLSIGYNPSGMSVIRLQ